MTTPLDPAVAQRVANLSFRASSAVEGLLSGIHRSPHRGASVVFVEHRAYRPGDDLRLLDWRAFARTDRHNVKRFEQETQLRALLLLDRSQSMNWAGFDAAAPGRTRNPARSNAPPDGAVQKRDHAATLLAALAYVLIGQGDEVGAAGFDVSLHGDFAPPRRRPNQLDVLMRILANPDAGRPETDLAVVLRSAADLFRQRGVVAIGSDLLDLQPEALHPLRQLVARGHEVVVFHVLHEDELSLRHTTAARFVGLEEEPAVEANVAEVGEAYNEELRRFRDRCRTTCTRAGARYIFAPTNTPVAHTLAELLTFKRGRR